MQNLVGPLSGLSILVSLVCLIVSEFDKGTATARSPNWVVYGMISMSLGFIEFGLLGNYVVLHSPRPIVIGRISQIGLTAGRYQGTLLTVDASPAPVTVHIASTHRQLNPGDLVKVQYIDDHDKQMLKLDVLDGSFVGWHLEGSDSVMSGYFMAGMGFVFAFGAWSWIKNESSKEKVESNWTRSHKSSRH